MLVLVVFLGILQLKNVYSSDYRLTIVVYILDPSSCFGLEEHRSHVLLRHPNIKVKSGLEIEQSFLEHRRLHALRRPCVWNHRSALVVGEYETEDH